MDAAAQVAAIVQAAEQAAEQMRIQAEQRANERIAEANRAAEYRVQAAEAEALEILANAEEQADQIRAKARDEAHATTAEARSAVREVLDDGTELSGDLADLSSSLRANAERLLRDIKMAYAAMVSRLDQATGPGPSSYRAERASSSGFDDLDVPEFTPPR